MTLAESTILVVDDEPLLRLTFSIVLKQTGAAVLVAQDGIDALNVLTVEAVDVILTDNQMPNMDGITLLQQARARGVVAPAVFFVNDVTTELREAIESLTAVRTVSKPLHSRELVRVLEDVAEPLTQRRSRQGA